LSEIALSWTESDAILSQLTEMARISALEEMASGIAHEVNQPLGAIATFAQAGERMLNRPDPLVSRALEVFRQISKEALGAGDGIRRIRRLFDHEESHRTRCQMQDVIAELRPVLEMLAQRTKGSIQLELPTETPELNIDRLKIQHVLHALVQNAFDASVHTSSMPHVKIEVSCDRYNVQTRVIDSGPGVSADIQKQLFSPFFTTKPRGSGLGLASSRAIIASHEGTIGFDNLPSRGSSFWFRLPAAGV
jgi:two-component system sensor kinase FixL